MMMSLAIDGCFWDKKVYKMKKEKDIMGLVI